MIIIIFLLLFGHTHAQYSVSVMAGGLTTDQGSVVDGQGLYATFNWPQALAIDPKTGFVFVADTGSNKIRRITSLGLVSTFAGTGDEGSNNGIGINATFNHPHGIAIDSKGNVFVADTWNNKIRKISPSGWVSNFVGSGMNGSRDGLGEVASFYDPHGITIDRFDNLYISDYKNKRVRKVSSTGLVSTITASIGLFQFPTGIAIDKIGNLFVADTFTSKIRKISYSGIASLVNMNSYRLSFPYGVTVDDSGTLIVADSGNSRVLLISPSGMASVISKGGIPYGVSIYPNGSVVYFSDVDNQINKITFCPSGYYEETGECHQCQAGTYSTTHSFSCTPCQEGTESDDTRTFCICSDPSTMWDPYSASCIPSPLYCSVDNYFSNVTNSCVPCPSGYHSGLGAFACIICPTNKIWDSKSYQCIVYTVPSNLPFPSTKDTSSLPLDAIIGGTVGGAALLTGIGVSIWYYRSYKSKYTSASETQLVDSM